MEEQYQNLNRFRQNLYLISPTEHNCYGSHIKAVSDLNIESHKTYIREQ